MIEMQIHTAIRCFRFSFLIRFFLPEFCDFNRSSQQCRIRKTDKSISSELRRTEKLS